MIAPSDHFFTGNKIEPMMNRCLLSLSAFAWCQGAQDLEPLLVSICTPDLKCGYAVTRLLSEASGDGGRRGHGARKRSLTLTGERVRSCGFSRDQSSLSGGANHSRSS